jgi:hypothetical protein
MKGFFVENSAAVATVKQAVVVHLRYNFGIYLQEMGKSTNKGTLRAEM